MVRAVGIREIVLGLWRGHVITVGVLVVIWICIGGGVSGHGGTGFLDMADG